MEARAASWSDAVATASAKLAEERATGKSFSSKYVGSPLAALVLRGQGKARIAQYCLVALSVPLCIMYSRAVGFGPVSIAVYSMACVNLSLKAIVFGVWDPLGHDEAPLYMILRGLPPESLDRALILPLPWQWPTSYNWFGLRGWFILGGWLTPVMLVAAACFFGCMFGAGIVAVGSGTLSTLEVAAVIGFIACISLLFLCAVPTLYFAATAIEFKRSLRTFELWRGEFGRAPKPSVLSPPRRGQSLASAPRSATRVVPFSVEEPESASPGLAADDESAEVNFSEAYKNFALMKSALRGFNGAFRWFFFGGEFTLVLAIILGSFASYHEVAACMAADATQRALALMRAIATVSLLIFCIIVTWSLLVLAAAMTDAARTVRGRIHTVCMRLAASRQYEQLEEARRFKELVEDEVSSLGFGFAGVTVSPAFVASIAYAALSVGTAIGSILLERNI